MKLTLNIDDELLDRVREMTGAKTKTEAIHIALHEMDRRNKLIELLAKDDFGMTAADWKSAWEDPGPEAEEFTARVAETPGKTAPASAAPKKPVTYGRKPRSRR
jgi:Arc/MetJ family transcription regulator